MKNFAELPIGWHGECTWGNKSTWCECMKLGGTTIAWKNNLGNWGTMIRSMFDCEEYDFRPLKSDNAWKERGELPPVGSWCEVEIHGDWHRCEIIAHVKQPAAMVAVFAAETNGVGNGKEIDYFVADRFRPIQSGRDKAIAAACKVIEAGDYNTHIDISFALRKAVEDLIDAGFKLPEGESDARD